LISLFSILRNFLKSKKFEEEKIKKEATKRAKNLTKFFTRDKIN